MNKVDKLLKNIRSFIQKAQDDESLEGKIADFPGKEKIVEIIEDYETAVARCLRNQRKHFLEGFKGFVSKDDKITLEAFIRFLQTDLFAEDDFADEFGEETADFLQMTIEELTSVIMESIDRDVSFEVLSGSTTQWIKDWSEDLAELMKLKTHTSLENKLVEALENGESIADVELKMKDMPEFNRNRARATARTEILTASSRANWEAYQQSPAVTQKKWKHSGAKKNDPRETHMDMDGVTIDIDEYFVVDGEEGLYPRDPSFSAKNRVNCGCALGPVVDENILGMDKEEKEAIRQQVLEDLSE